MRVAFRCTRCVRTSTTASTSQDHLRSHRREVWIYRATSSVASVSCPPLPGRAPASRAPEPTASLRCRRHHGDQHRGRSRCDRNRRCSRFYRAEGGLTHVDPAPGQHRKQHHPSRSGAAKGGTQVAFGEYGIQALEPAYITNRQIESARIAMTRHISVAARSGSTSSRSPAHQEACRDPHGFR